jgi:hypothetical protein
MEDEVYLNPKPKPAKGALGDLGFWKLHLFWVLGIGF